MGKQVFVPFDLKPKDIKALTPHDKQHLLNLTNAWIDQNEEAIRSKKTLIIVLPLGLVGSVLFLLIMYVLLTSFVVPALYPLVDEILVISVVLLTLAFLNSPQLRLFQLRRIKKRIGTLGTAQKEVRFYFLKDHIKQLLTPQTQTFVHSGKRTYTKKQVFQALLFAVLICLTYFCSILYGYYVEHIFPNNQTFPGLTPDQTLQFLFSVWNMLYIPPAVFLTLLLKKLIDVVISFFR